MADPRLLPAGHSAAFLDPGNLLARAPRAPNRLRPAGFLQNYETRALFYDCFWHVDGKRILLVGPPPQNLKPAYGSASFTAAGAMLKPRFHISQSVMITELPGAPAGTAEIVISLGGQTHNLPVQPNLSERLRGHRVLFTMSKDNDLPWIAEWAHYHARFHGTDAVVFFDNGSKRYSIAEIEQTLLGVAGIKAIAVLSWPYIYGAPDPAVRINPFYVQFLQVSAMSIALRRYSAFAAGLLNLDIDELVRTPSGTTIYDHLARTRHGLAILSGQFIEPVPTKDASAQRTHRHFQLRHKDPQHALSRPRKWAIDPQRPWVRNLDVHPYMHWISGRPPFSKTEKADIFYFHFRGISTNWKDRRADLEGLDISQFEIDPIWPGLAAKL